MWRRLLTAAVVAATLLLPGCSRAGSPTAAGIVAYSTIQGRTYVLLADHPGTDRGWGAFGGRREPGESVAEAAAREFREETRCVYGDTPSAEDLAGRPTVTQDIFVSFVIEVPYVPLPVFESDDPPMDCTGSAFEERGPWAWVPLDVLPAVFEEGESTGAYVLPAEYLPRGATRVFWDKSATVVAEAVENGLLPVSGAEGTGAAASPSRP